MTRGSFSRRFTTVTQCVAMTAPGVDLLRRRTFGAMQPGGGDIRSFGVTKLFSTVLTIVLVATLAGAAYLVFVPLG